MGHGLPEGFFVYLCHRFCYRFAIVLEPQVFTQFGGLLNIVFSVSATMLPLPLQPCDSDV